MAVGNLKKQASKKNEGSLAYVKGGLSTFFEAQDALAGTYAWCACLNACNLVRQPKMAFMLLTEGKEAKKKEKEKEYSLGSNTGWGWIVSMKILLP